MVSPVYRFEPTTTIHPDTVGFYPFTFNGNVDNSGKRLQRVANESGMMIMAAEVMGQTSRRIFDLAARDALCPGPNFNSTCQRTAESLSPALAEFPNRVGIGHSLGGVVITGMQQHAEQPPFTMIQLCDSFNLRAPQWAITGYGRFIGYQALDFLQGLFHPVSTDNKSAITLPDFDPVTDENSIVTKMKSLGPLMRSNESRAGAYAMACSTQLPLHVIGLSHGLAGSDKQLQLFLDKLVDDRQSFTDHLATKALTPAPLVAERQEGWHSDLMNPYKVADNLETTLSLRRFSVG